MSHATLCFLSYNRPEFLAKAITTALAHIDEPVELIVHDDGSTDGRVREVIADLQRYGWISTAIFNAPGHNEGQGIALNRMFGMATGDVIFKLDQDLDFNPDWLRASLGILSDNDFDHGLGNQPRIGLLGLLHYHADPVDTAKMKLAEHGAGAYAWEEHHQILGSAFAVPRVAWEQFGPFETRSAAFAEDNAFQLAITRADGWACALPAGRNLVENHNMGPGPSTIVSYGSEGDVVVTAIQPGPKLIQPDVKELPR